MAPLDLVAQVAADASELYARNIYHLLATMMRDQLIALDWNDEILVQSVVTHAGVAKNSGFSVSPVTPELDAESVCPV